MTTQQQSALLTLSPDKNPLVSTDSPDIIGYLLHLHGVAQQLCGQTQGVVDRICKEVVHITEGRARLYLHRLSLSEDKRAHTFDVLLSLPVQFRQLVYGTLLVAPDAAKPMTPALPLDTAHVLAQFCGWLLYTVEQAAFVQGRCNQLEQTVYARLTRREREVLVLIGYGYDREAIAYNLSIAPTTVDKHRQHIYKQLGVHSQRDALLAAYAAGLFSPLEEVRSQM